MTLEGESYPRGLHPDDVLLRHAQQDPLLQDPLLAAVQGEGQLQPPHPDSPGQEELYATICKSATPYVKNLLDDQLHATTTFSISI
jgi:hypothetical protein